MNKPIKAIFETVVKSIFYLLIVAVALVSCEEEYIPDTVFDRPQIVVEGYIEQSPNALPPYVILTRSSPFLATLDTAAINALFVHGAEVWVSDGTDSVQLTEICLSDIAALDSALAQSVAQGLGFGGSSNGVNFCFYVDADAFISGMPSLNIRTYGRYNLRINAEGQTLTATTTMPLYIPIDSFSFTPRDAANPNDSLFQLYGYFTDPVGEQNYYRIFSRRNQEPMYAASSLATGTSVTDDKIFNGQSFQFDILRGQPISAEFDPQTYGFFRRGDTVAVRGAALDYEHFRFWQTVEFNANSQGPFGTYVRIKSNVNGGLGVWGAIGYEDYTIILPR
jgi:hypothetical protein